MNIATKKVSKKNLTETNEVLSVNTDTTSQLKTFFDQDIDSILSTAGKIKKVEGSIIQYSGSILPCSEIFKHTQIIEFRILSLLNIISYQLSVNAATSEVEISFVSKKINVDSKFSIDTASLSLSISYSNKLTVSSIAGKSNFTLNNTSHTDISVNLNKNIIELNISNFEPVEFISTLFEGVVKLNPSINKFLGQHGTEDNPLNLSVGYNLSTKTMDFTASASKGVGPDLLAVKKLYLHKTIKEGILANLTIDSSYNGTYFIQDQILDFNITGDSCIINADIDFPNIDLGDLLNSVNIFAEQVVVIEKKNWHIQADLFKQTLNIESPMFEKWLAVNICDTLKFSSSHLKLTSDKLLNLDVAATGGLFLGGSELIQGSLNINRSGSDFNGKFVATDNNQKAKFSLPYSTTNHFDVSVGIENLNLSLSKDNIKGKSWNYDVTDASVTLANLPNPLNILNNKSIVGSISGNKTIINLSIDNIAGLKTPCSLAIPLPEMYFVDIDQGIKTDKVSPGEMMLTVSNLSFDLKNPIGKQIEGQIGITLPEKINGLFGLNKGKPLFDVFRSYPGDYDKLSADQKKNSEIRFDLSKKENALLLTLESSPFEKLDIQTDGNSSTLHDIDLGELGKYQCTMPAFGYDDKLASWVAAGSLKIDKLPSAIPLSVIKQLLERYNLNILNKLIPDSLPLLSSPSENTPASEIIIPLLEKAGLNNLVNCIKPFEDTVNKIMSDIIQYNLPKAINYKIAYCEGSYSLDLDIVPPTSGKLGSFKMMLPCYGPSLFGPQPGIATLELFACSWGSLYGVPYLNLDAKVHFLDLGSMVISQVLHQDTSHLGSELTLHNLFIINPFVDPVPVFIDDFNCQYRGIEQMTIESQFALPKPGSSVFDIASLIQSLFVFFTTDRKLTTSMFPSDVKLEFTIGKNYIQLPSYLSGATFGKTSPTTLNGTNYIVSFLNWLKSFALNDLIESLPEEYRNLSLPTLSIGGIDLVKAEGGLISLAEAPAKVKNTLPELKKINSALLANISSHLSIHSIADLDCTLGMAVNVKEGSGIYSVIQGDLSPLMEINLAGDVLFKPEQPYLTSEGKCTLDACNHTLLDCDYHLSGGHFDIEGTLNGDFLEEIEDEVAKLVQQLVSFDAIQNTVSDISNKTGLVNAKQVVVNTAKAGFDDAKRGLDSASSAFQSAKGGLDSANHEFNDAEDKLDSVVHQCDHIKPHSIWTPFGSTTNPLYSACTGLLSAAIAVAKAPLEAAKGVLSAAKVTLSVAQQAMKAAQVAFDAAKATLDTANSALTLAQNELQKAVKLASDLEKKVGAELYNLVKDITKFSLNFASLKNTTMKGTLTNNSVGFGMALTIKVLGKTVKLPKISLNIHDPITGTARDIASKVMKEII